jgi:hypothetical protein
MNEYISKDDYLYRAGRNSFKLEDFGNIIEKMKKISPELEIRSNTKKYNL